MVEKTIPSKSQIYIIIYVDIFQGSTNLFYNLLYYTLALNSVKNG